MRQSLARLLVGVDASAAALARIALTQRQRPQSSSASRRTAGAAGFLTLSQCFEASGFFGVCAPKNIPAEIANKLNREINAGLADSKIKERIVDLGGMPMPMSPAEFGKFIGEETVKWRKVIRAAGITGA
jgi:hypothetical protein